MSTNGSNRYRIVNGHGPKPRPRTPAQRMTTRRRARQHAQETVVALSDFLPRPLTDAWNDGRRGQQYWWGNLMRHMEELADSPTPPTFADLLRFGEVLAWAAYDLLEDRGLHPEIPNPDDPMQRALMRGRAA